MLFTFPSRYLFTIGRTRVLRLGGWSPHVQTEFHVFRLTRGHKCFLPVRGYHPLLPTFPDRSCSYTYATGLVRVRSPLLPESQLMSFPTGTEMFQFPAFASLAGWSEDRVSPFGNRRIKAYSQLPDAYRSVSRPSSPVCAKASTERPFGT